MKEQNLLSSLTKVALSIILSTSTAWSGAFAQDSETLKWSGLCTRLGKPDGRANLALTSKFGSSRITGTLNARTLSNIQYDPDAGTISFDTPGIFQDHAVVRHFQGTMDANGAITATLTQDEGEKSANCSLTVNR